MSITLEKLLKFTVNDEEIEYLKSFEKIIKNFTSLSSDINNFNFKIDSMRILEFDNFVKLYFELHNKLDDFEKYKKMYLDDYVYNLNSLYTYVRVMIRAYKSLCIYYERDFCITNFEISDEYINILKHVDIKPEDINVNTCIFSESWNKNIDPEIDLKYFNFNDDISIPWFKTITHLYESMASSIFEELIFSNEFKGIN